ncbi:replication origin binding [Vibrio phage D30]
MFVILSAALGDHPSSRGIPYTVSSKTGNYFVKTFSDKNPAGSPPKMVTLFDVEEIVEPITLLQTLKMVNKYREKHYMFAIRYAPVLPLLELENMKRLRRSPDNFYLGKPSPIMFMDIDTVDLPDHIEWWDVEGQGRYVTGLMHEQFPELIPENVGFIAKASGSSGIKTGKIRLHLYIENEAFITPDQCAYIAHQVFNKDQEFLDPAPYHPRQSHFIADPAFLDSQVDPYKEAGKKRVAYVEGARSTIRANTPKYIFNKAATVRSKHHRMFSNTIGSNNLTARVCDKLEFMAEKTEGMFIRHVPSLYHMAWEDGISLDYLEKIPTQGEEDTYGMFLRTILSKYGSVQNGKRTINDYFNNGRKACVSKMVGEADRSIPKTINIARTATNDIGHSDEMPDNIRGASWRHNIEVQTLATDSKQQEDFIRLEKLPPEDSIAFIKASLGTGKTTAVKMWLALGKVPGRFLSVTNTRALVDSNAQKFGAPEDEAYRKMKFHNEYYNNPNGRMSTTIHSLHRYKEMAELGMIDFLFIDEADAVMSELLNSTLMRERNKCISTLEALLDNCKYIVLSDGDIGEETIESYVTLGTKGKPVVAYDHHRPMLRNAKAWEVDEEESIWAIVNASLSCSEKTIVVTDLGPEALNIRQKTLANLHPGQVVKQIHANSSSDNDISEILKYTNTALESQKIDCLLCSPSVTNGVDFRYFDNICVITKATTQAPNLRFQALRRDRGAKYIYYYTDDKTKSFRSGYTTDFLDKDLGWLARHQAKFGLRRYRECQRFPTTLRYYLLDQGCRVEIMNDEWDKLDYSEATKECNEERINAIVMATELHTQMRHNDAWDAKNEVVKYYDLDSIDCVCHETAGLYVKEKPNKKMQFLHDIVKGGLWKHIRQCVTSPTPFIKFLEKHGDKFYQATGNSANPYLGKMYVGMCGIVYDEETGMADFEKVINWYRAFCLMNELKIPRDFMTEAEKILDDESNSDLGLRGAKAKKAPVQSKPLDLSTQGGVQWGSFAQTAAPVYEEFSEPIDMEALKAKLKATKPVASTGGLSWGQAKS